MSGPGAREDDTFLSVGRIIETSERRRDMSQLSRWTVWKRKRLKGHA